MGVRGFVPFLQKAFPSVLQQLPNRLKDIKGKRLVIDATLITQRFHFAPSNYTNRHVLGWYRIAKELKANNVSAICVFDGKERHAAKAREAQKRRDTFRLNSARANVEGERLSRLQQLSEAFRSYEQLSREDRLSVLGNLKASDVGMTNHSLATLRNAPGGEGSATHAEESAGSVPSELLDKPSSQDSATLSEQFRSLFLNYQGHAAKLTTLASQQPEKKVDDVLQNVTRAQHDLMLLEGDVWTNLRSFSLQPTAVDLELSPSLPADLESIMDRSFTMSNSFQRRTDRPTPQTFQESQEILSAMGIPCLETRGGVEAEALAASMVLNGMADYVATEDTDVLVYEAPMLRNLANHFEPLTLISGDATRQCLGLDRNAFIDFALLLGTDFSERIKNVGPRRAHAFLQKYGCIEDIIASEPDYPPTLAKETYLAQVQIARVIFKTLPSINPLDPTHAQVGEKNDAEVARIMEKHDLGRILHEDQYDEQEASLVGNYFSDRPFDFGPVTSESAPGSTTHKTADP